ncbi:MAG TPA: ABC transporter permease [Candidatus Acidoferrales bacterium]|nr:ABC transporter permease [Candidatus Acidoferrales bacterium]
MRRIDKLRLRLRSLFRRERVDGELNEELRFHLERQIVANVASGMSPDAARRAALREFGGIDQIREECADMRRINWLQDFFQDVHYGLRMLRKSPGFTIVAILTLALGIGANTAIFSVVYAVLLKPLPYPHPTQLVVITDSNSQKGIRKGNTSYQDFLELRDQNHVFSDVGGLTGHDLTLTGRGDPFQVDTASVTPGLLAAMGVKPLAGRIFLPEDGKRGAAPVVILSENLWRDRFGADPRAIGTAVNLDMRDFTIVGIMPSNFRYPFFSSEQIWIPVQQDPLFGSWMNNPDLRFMGITARLKPGVSIANAQAELDAVSARIAKKFPAEDKDFEFGVAPLQEDLVGGARKGLLILLGCVGLVLLIACANISNLLLARATSRTREMAVRSALGAGRLRIVRQLLAESAVLGMLGAIAGILLAYWGVHALRSLVPSDLTRLHAITLDGWVLAFSLALAVLASIIFGLAPAFFAADSRLTGSLKNSARAGEGRQWTRNALAVAEIALAMLVLVAAGLLGRSFLTLTSVNPGFDPNHVVKAEIDLPRFQYSKPAQWTAFGDELLRRVQAQPGMHDSAIGIPLPLAHAVVPTLPFDIVAGPPPRPGTIRTADYGATSPQYLRVMGIPLLRGRWFNSQDRPDAPLTTVISEAFAHRYFPNQNPIGKQLSFSFPPAAPVPRQIVGIVGDVHDTSLARDPSPMMYVPFAQAPFWGAEIVTRSDLSTGVIASTIRAQVGKIDKNLPVTGVEAMNTAIDSTVVQPRFRASLVALFGAMALILAAAGIFGVISYSVSRRTHEIGIRMALGASGGNVTRMILGESARVILIGLALGVAIALGLTRLLANLLFGVRPADPLTFVAVGAVLVFVGLAAAYVPARRAMRVDPVTAMRCE